MYSFLVSLVWKGEKQNHVSKTRRQGEHEGAVKTLNHWEDHEDLMDTFHLFAPIEIERIRTVWNLQKGRLHEEGRKQDLHPSG